MSKKQQIFFHKFPFYILPLMFFMPLLCASVPTAEQRPIVETLDNPSELVQQGKTLYDAGQFSEAAKILQEAVETFAKQEETLKQAIALSNFSLVYQELGQWLDAKNAIASSLNLLTKSPTPPGVNLQILAQALDIQGRLQLATGQAEDALSTWQNATETYIKAGDDSGAIASQINQAQAMQALGLYRRASETLEQIEKILQKQPDSPIKATALRSLGDSLRIIGNVERSRQVLEQSLQIVKLFSPRQKAATLISLGNTARAAQDTKAALTFYQQAAEASVEAIARIQAQLNQLHLIVEAKEWSNAQTLLPQIQSQLNTLPASRQAVYAKINLAKSLMKMQKEDGQPISNSEFSNPTTIAQLLASAVKEAQSLKDLRSESYAIGTLGGLYEQTQQWSEGRDLTEQALLAAQAIAASDIAYQWQWQLGRLLKAQGDIPGAIAAYSQAVETLQSIRSDLVLANPDVQFSFRESVEPVYRQLVDILTQGYTANEKNLKQAREAIEGLQLAELDNFFREACLDAKPKQIDEIDPTAAVIYPIILPSRLEVIVSLPGQPLSHYATSLPQSEVESILQKLRRTLIPSASTKERLRLSQQVYDWLIRPAEVQLAESQVKTLVFVLDGYLRNLPMAAIYDGQQYLVEKYAVALTPGLQLLMPKPLVQSELGALAGGLTEARQGFSALPAVQSEVNQIALTVRSFVLLNQDFTSTTLQEQIKAVPFPVVHLATHGQFSSNAEQTFILTWDGRINVRQLDVLLRGRGQGDRAPIELLVLSACQTAAGDNRAALGLAGVAVRSGARSTVATLWFVNDAATGELIGKFYQELAQNRVTKAEALRRAQVALLKGNRKNPYYWAPFVLVGNWV